MKPIKFHAVSGSSIHVSGDRTEAMKVAQFAGGGFCFTNRPLETGEKLLLRTTPDMVEQLRFGVTRNDPSTLQRNFLDLEDLSPGYDASTGIWAAPEHGVVGQISKNRTAEILAYFEPENCRLMVHDAGSEPKERITGVQTKQPVYLVVVLRKSDIQISINQAPEIIRIPIHPQSSSFPNLLLEPAHFEPFESTAVQVRPYLARTLDPLQSSGKFAVVNTLLKPGLTLVVQLLEATPGASARIALTSESSHRAYSYGDIGKLCDTADHSFMMNSGTLDRGEELAVGISSEGVVYVSHNNRAWIQRACVDTDLVYHVVFEMEKISLLTIVGMTNVEEGNSDEDRDAQDGPFSRDVENIECNTS